MYKKNEKTSQNIIKYYCEVDKKVTPKPKETKPQQAFQATEP